MHFKLVENPDDIHAVVYKIARVVYAQTHAASLRLVEAMTSMIANAALQSGRTVSEIVSDEKMPLEKIKPKPIVSTEYNRIIDALI